MTDAAPAPRRTVSLRSPSGKTVLTLPILPAAAATLAALALAPRLTALAALGALARRMSLTLDGVPALHPGGRAVAPAFSPPEAGTR